MATLHSRSFQNIISLMIPLLLALGALVAGADAKDYYGVKVGSLRDETHGIDGDVWLVNETALQITNWKLRLGGGKQVFNFYFSTGEKNVKAQQLFQVVSAPGEDYSRPIANDLGNEWNGETIVVLIPGEYETWKFFGVVKNDEKSYLSSVKLDKDAPAPYCCITDKENIHRGLVGFFYNVASGPITLLDAKTILIPKFSFEGTKPPDGWIFTGKGTIDKATGKRAYVVGRDTKQRHCPLHEDYNGHNDLIIRLADDQTVYDINYVSVFCYEFAVDFGHVLFDLHADRVAVPPYIPPLRQRPNAVHALTKC